MLVAAIVGRSVSDCRDKVAEDGEELERKRAERAAASAATAAAKGKKSKEKAAIVFEHTEDNKVVITGAKGTLKRRRQLRELVSQVW